MRLKNALKVIVFLVLSAFNNAYAQESNFALHVGDVVPPYVLKNLLNYKTIEANISDFKGKLLILDFWTTSCTSCIASWPKLEKLQEQFKSQIRFILINAWQPKSEITNLIDLRKNKGLPVTTLPVSCGDKEILRLFPVAGVPHIVIIDEQQKVQYITYSSVLTSDKLKAILNKEKIKIDTKSIFKYSIDVTQSVLTQANINLDHKILWQSFLSSYNDSLPTVISMVTDTVNSKYSIAMIAMDVLGMYQFAFSTDKFDRSVVEVLSNRTELYSKDSIELGKDKNTFTTDNLYNYQLISGRKVNEEKLQQLMQEDLKRYFGYKVEWVKKKKACLVLSMLDSLKAKRFKPAQNLSVEEYDAAQGYYFTESNITVEDFLEKLVWFGTYYSSPYPFIDETNYFGRLNFELTGDYKNYRILDKELKKQGMSVKLEDREVEVLVISDSPNSNFFKTK